MGCSERCRGLIVGWRCGGHHGDLNDSVVVHGDTAGYNVGVLVAIATCGEKGHDDVVWCGKAMLM